MGKMGSCFFRYRRQSGIAGMLYFLNSAPSSYRNYHRHGNSINSRFILAKYIVEYKSERDSLLIRDYKKVMSLAALIAELQARLNTQK